MNRRTLLRRGLLGGALLAVGSGTALALWPTRRTHVPTGPLLVLDERAFAVLAAIAARVVVAPAADPVDIAHVIDRALARAVPEARADVRQLLALFDNALAGALLDGRLRPFTALDADGQDAVLRAWRDSRLVLRRSGYKALRNLCATSFYRQEKAWAQAGYDGPPAWLLAVQAAQLAAEKSRGTPALAPEPPAPVDGATR